MNFNYATIPYFCSKSCLHQINKQHKIEIFPIIPFLRLMTLRCPWMTENKSMLVLTPLPYFAHRQLGTSPKLRSRNRSTHQKLPNPPLLQNPQNVFWTGGRLRTTPCIASYLLLSWPDKLFWVSLATSLPFIIYLLVAQKFNFSIFFCHPFKLCIFQSG